MTSSGKTDSPAALNGTAGVSTGSPLEFSDGDFDSMIASRSLPIMVDFWAPWCGPCKKLAPTIEGLAIEYEGKAIIAKLNTQNNPRTPSQLGIRGIPTIIFFRNGKEVERLVGIQTRSAYQKVLNRLIAESNSESGQISKES